MLQVECHPDPCNMSPALLPKSLIASDLEPAVATTEALLLPTAGAAAGACKQQSREALCEGLSCCMTADRQAFAAPQSSDNLVYGACTLWEAPHSHSTGTRNSEKPDTGFVGPTCALPPPPCCWLESKSWNGLPELSDRCGGRLLGDRPCRVPPARHRAFQSRDLILHSRERM